MAKSSFNSMCERANPFYYDFLCGEGHAAIPETIVKHIENCQNCRERMNKLKAILSKLEYNLTSEKPQACVPLVTMLRLHYAYIGRDVNCDVVKPFLPSLLDQTLEIKIPTPITVHLDNCQQCSDDLEAIRSLHLNCSQLRRLSRLFAEEPSIDAQLCIKARDAVSSVVAMVFAEIDEEVLKHLCLCSDCRKLIGRHREMVCRGLMHSRPMQESFSCDKVSNTDVFDYIIPYEIDFTDRQCDKFRPALVSHTATCPRCLAKVQQLHKTVYDIAERAESGIVTVFDIDESAKSNESSKSNCLYSGFPIKVTVNGRKAAEAEQPTPVAHLPNSFRQKNVKMNLKSLARITVAAAAVLMVTLLVFNSSVAKAVAVSQIYEALEKIKNVYLATFITGETETKPVQEVWISQDLQTKLSKTETQWAFWNVADGFQKVKNLDTDSLSTLKLNDEHLAKVKETMSASWALLPFKNTTEVPKDAKWHHITDGVAQAAISGTVIYDLVWAEKSSSGLLDHKKWRGYIDTETKLPSRIERWEKLAGKRDYELKTIFIVTYPTADEIRTVIKDSGL